MERTIRYLAALATILFALHVFSDNKADVDLWGNLGFVKTMPWSSDFTRTNTYSFTEPEHSWINHEWLGEYILNAVYSLGSDTSLLAMKTLMGLILIALFFISMKRDRVSGSVIFFSLLLVISTIGYGFSTRPHHFTYLLYAVFLYTLKHFSKNKPLILIALPCLGFLWANLHGAFFIGLLTLAVYSSIEALKHFWPGQRQDRNTGAPLPALCIPLFFAVSLINPYGISLWQFVFSSAAKFRPFLSEWAPFNPFEHSFLHPDFAALVVFSLASVLTSRKHKDPTWMTILALSFIAALALRRNIPLFAITAVFVIPEHLENAAGNALNRMIALVPGRILASLLAAFICLSSAFFFTFNKTNPFKIEIPSDKFPVEIVDFVKENNLKGNMLVFFDWAEYCIWKLYPDCRIFLDGRFDTAYSNPVIDEFFSFLSGTKGWQNTLVRHNVEMVLIHKGNPVYADMGTLSDWSLVNRNRCAALFLRNDVYASFLNKAVTGSAILPVVKTANYFP